MKRLLPYLAIMCFLVFTASVSANAQSSLYEFAGNLKSYKKTHDHFEATLKNGAVRISYLKGVGFRVRYSFTGTFSKLFSYATVTPMPSYESLSVSDRGDSILVKAGDLTAIVHKKPFRLSFANNDGWEFIQETYGAGHSGKKLAHIIKWEDGTQFYGLGERPDDLLRTGKTYTLWNSDTPGYPKGTEPIYQSMPFYIGLNTKGAWGIFYDNSFKTQFDFGGQLKTHIGFYSEGGELRFYVFYGPKIKQILKEYTTLTGRFPLPPKWALGYQQSRWGYYPDKEFYRLAYEFRSREIPCDVLYTDIDYMDQYRVFSWSKRYFPHPVEMMSNLRKKGFKVIPIVDPGIKIDKNWDVFNEGVKKNVFVKYPGGKNYVGTVWPGKVYFPDFSNPVTRKWWEGHVADFIKMGVAGVWNDMNEPSVFGGKTMPNFVEFDKDGMKASALEMHNLYGLLMARSSYQGQLSADPNKRPFIITRASFAGVQRYSSIWTGDNSAKWQDVKLTMPMVMSLGLAGVPDAGFDIGGFNGSPTGQMYMRFLQIGIFMPFCRTHTSIDTRRQEPWSYGQMYEYINKKMIQLRYKLLPVLYTSFYEHTVNGSPIIRPLSWDYQSNQKVWGIDNQFMFGDHMMVAPVVDKDANQRTLYLPKGTWYQFFTNKKYEGDQTITVNAPIDAVNVYDKVFTHPYAGLPLFVQAGAVIPMQEVQQYVGQKDITNMNLRVYDGASRKSELYEDDGHSQNYRNGDYRLTTFSTESSAKELSVKVAMDGKYEGGAKTFTWEVYGIDEKPAEVKIDGKGIDFTYDEATHTVSFKTDARPMSVEITK
ncbi:MAG TPA: glycoside hydrolase family 31 protein [Balneolales bacterium]|nr:glycoside hydrolase family 31 protein [Balneolales bacterium]